MNKLEYDGCYMESNDANFSYCTNELNYSQSLKTPLQTDGKFLYLKDGYIFAIDIPIGDEIEVQVTRIDYIYGNVTRK